MADLFEEKASDWDANERRSKLSAAIGSSILKHVKLHDQMTVMDFGAGTGLIAAQVVPKVKRVVAIDTSQAMLDKLAAKPELKSRIDIICQDIVENPIDTRFDLIMSAMTLHHVENTSLLIERFAEHLNEDGVVALADLDTEDGSFHPANTQGVFHSGFDRDAIGSVLEKHGFREIEFFTAHNINGDEKDYPVFLVIARKT